MSNQPTRNQRRADLRRAAHNQRFQTDRSGAFTGIRPFGYSASSGQTRNHKPRNWHMPAGGSRMLVSPHYRNVVTIDPRWDK